MSSGHILFTLPVELVIEIIQSVLEDSGPYVDIVNLSHVNTALRRIVVTSPLLWRFIRIDCTAGSLELAKLSLSRSQGCQLNFQIYLDSNTTTEHLDNILDFFRSTYPSPVQIFFIVLELGSEADSSHLLEAYGLDVINTSNIEQIGISHSRWMSHDEEKGPVALPPSPQLRRLTLGGVYPSLLRGSTFNSVTYLCLSNPHDTPWTAEGFQDVIQQFPNVEELRFEETDIYEDLLLSFPLPKLRRIDFGVHPRFISQVLQHFEAPNLRAIAFHCPLCSWQEDMSREDALRTPCYPAVRLLELQDGWIAFPPKLTALFLPQSLPNLEHITLYPSSCDFILETVHQAREGSWTSFWDNLQDIVILGELQSEPEYFELVECLTTFTSTRNAIDRGGGKPPSPLVIVFGHFFPWENIVKKPMENLIQEVVKIQIGQSAIAGALGQIGANPYTGR